MGGARMNKANAYIAAGVTVLVLLGSAIETSETMPDNAIIYGNSLNKTYYGEPTRKNKMIILNDNKKNNKSIALEDMAERYTEKMPLSQAKRMQYEPDRESINNGDFIGETHSLIYVFFQRVGILPRQPRWNPDGTWNW
jgi:hypothetical protein